METRYAPIKLELVAVIWPTTKCWCYLLGLPHLTAMTDHRPLKPILESYTLNGIKIPRLQSLKEKIVGYVLTAQWSKGKALTIPNALSGAPVDRQAPEDVVLREKACRRLGSVVMQHAAVLDASPIEDLVLDGMNTMA